MCITKIKVMDKKCQNNKTNETNTKSTLEKRVFFRADETLYSKIQQEANEEMRSIPNQIRMIIERYFNNKDKNNRS